MNNPLIEKAKKELRDFFDKTLKAKKPTMKNLERELLVNFLDTFAKDLLEMARRETEVEPRKHGIVYGDVSSENQEIVGAGFNLALSAVSAKWDDLLKKNGG